MKNIHKVSLLVALVGSLIALKAFNVSNGLQATHSQLDFENDTITVPGSSTGMNTGIVLPIGEHIEITAEGSVNTWPQEPTNPWGGPNGNGSLCTSECLMPAANFGALIGRLGGNGEWFLIGSYKAFFADVSDELIMAVNDTVHDDNIGSFTVSVRVGVIDNSLVGEYLFNEGTGNVINDTSGQERHGTIHGAQWVTSPILDNNGQPGYALQFNHTHASVPSDVLKHLPLSISLWVKPEGNVNDKRNNIISNDIPMHSGHGIGISQAGYIFLEYEDVGGLSFRNTSYQVQWGRWYHIVAVYESGRIRTYVNAQLVDDFTYAQAPLDAADSFLIGRHNFDPQLGNRVFYNGVTDSVRIYHKALSQEEILGLSGELPQIVISHIEVTQVIQDEDNNVPLIAGKPTFVRVYVDCGVGCTVIPGVTGTLEVSSSAGTATYQPNMGPITVEHLPTGWASQRGDLRKTLNFYTISTDLLTGDVTFTAQVGNATLSRPFIFEPANRLRIAWVPIHYQPNQPDPPNYRPDPYYTYSAWILMNKIYPVNHDDLEYFYQPVQPEEQLVSSSPFTKESAWNEYLPLLQEFWNITTHMDGWQGGQPDRLFGWVPQKAQVSIDGYAFANWPTYGWHGSGLVAAGISNKHTQRILAHELGHLLGVDKLLHAPCGLDGNSDPEYPPDHSDGTIDDWGIDFLGREPTMRAPDAMHQDKAYDYMSYCFPAWISKYHYEKLVAGFQQFSTLHVTRPNEPSPILLVSGEVLTPTLTVDFGTFYPLNSLLPPDENQGTDYCLELRDGNETTLDSRCFNLGFILPESGEPLDREAFVIVLPYPAETNAVVLTHLGAELDRATKSSSPPAVQLISPNGGEIWNATGTYTVTWTASDGDGDPLRFMVSYSIDDGETWMPLALDITDSFLAVDSPNIPGSATARFKVTATDQMLTGEDVSDASFTVGPKGPVAFILLPEREGTIPPGPPLYLQGSAYDLEDGTLRDNSLQWSSSIDGALGSGQMIIAMLSPGAHTIMLTATDSHGNQDTATLDLYVGHKLYLPVVRR